MEKEDARTVEDIKDDIMRTYLNNTNLLSERIVNAKNSVEPHLQELVAGMGCGKSKKQ